VDPQQSKEFLFHDENRDNTAQCTVLSQKFKQQIHRSKLIQTTNMTKPLVQGQIGYWVNGNLVLMPKKRTNNSDPKSDHIEYTHIKRNREHKMALVARQRQQKNLVRLKYRQDVPQRLIEKLKNVSKRGDIATVWRQLRELQWCSDYRNEYFISCVSIDYRNKERANNYFRLWTRCIFVPDSEERTALYYASLTGHYHIVRLYMSLYLMSAIQISEATVDASHTFRVWFSSLGGTNKMRLSNKFTLRDYDMCVLNALNEDIRHLLTRKKLTVSDAMNIVKEAMDPDKYGKISVAQSIEARMAHIASDVDRIRKFIRVNRSTKRKKPVLNNCMFEVRGKDDSNDLWVIEEDDEDTCTSINSEYDTYVDGVITTDEHEVTQDIVNKHERRAYANLSVASSISIDGQSFFEMNDTTEDFDSLSNFTILNDANSFGYSHISLTELCGDDDDDEEEETTQGWDVVSDLQSVKSIDTLMTVNSEPTMPLSISYRDILLKETKSFALCDWVEDKAPHNTLSIANKEHESKIGVKIAIT